MSDTTLACPECDSADIRPRHRVSAAWQCSECGASFDAAVEREKYCNAGNTSESIRALVSADPDEYP